VFSDLLTIEAIGPSKVSPDSSQVIVSLDCARSVLRGADVYSPGILAVEDHGRPVKINDHVSVWVDVESKCTRGLRTLYTGEKELIAEGILRKSRQEIFGSNGSGVAVGVTSAKYLMPSFDGAISETGCFIPQNLPSIVAINALKSIVQLIFTLLTS